MLEVVHGKEAICLPPQNVWSCKKAQERSISPLIPGSQADNEQVQDPELLHLHTSIKHVVWQAKARGETSGCTPLPALVLLSPQCHPLYTSSQHGKKMARCKAEIQLYPSRMPQAGLVVTL